MSINSLRIIPCLFVAALCGAAFVCAVLYPLPAQADIRKTDVVSGETVDARGLSGAFLPDVVAEYACVMDADGTVYFERNSHEHTHIASITKIMTAVVALDYASADTQITVSYNAATVGESSAELMQGDVLALNAALSALLVSSGNDAAVAIAETIGENLAAEGQDPVEAFVIAMNAKAQDLGLADTLFANPHGLDYDYWDEEMYSSAYDIAQLSAYAMSNDTFRSIVCQSSAVIEVLRDGETVYLELSSTNQMLDEYEGACGIKTGFTAYAGECFAGAASVDGRELYAVVLNSSTEEQRFADCMALLDWTYEHCVDYQLINTTEYVQACIGGQTGEYPILAHVAHLGWVDSTVAATVAQTETSLELFDLNGNISQSFEFFELHDDVAVGDVIGTVTFRQRNNVIAQYELIAAESVEGPNIFQEIGVWWDRLMRGFSGDAQVAQSYTVNTLPMVIDKTSLATA